MTPTTDVYNLNVLCGRVCLISVSYFSLSLLSMYWSVLLRFKRERIIRLEENKRPTLKNRLKRERVHVCVCGRSFHLHSSTCCFPSLSQTQPARNSDIYSINCQHNQHRYVRSLTSNTANTAETEAAVYLTQPLKYSTTVYRALNWLQLSLQTVSFLQGFFFLLFLFSFFNQSYHLILNQTLLSVLF